MVKHAMLAAAIVLYGVMLGHGHTPYFVAIMLAVVLRDWRRTRDPVGSGH
jgi:hypothetical protein